jgi:hypothetical protein
MALPPDMDSSSSSTCSAATTEDCRRLCQRHHTIGTLLGVHTKS